MIKPKAPRPAHYVPDSPNVGDVRPRDEFASDAAAAEDRAQADAIAAKVSTGDELAGYERVFGHGVPKP